MMTKYYCGRNPPATLVTYAVGLAPPPSATFSCGLDEDQLGVLFRENRALASTRLADERASFPTSLRRSACATFEAAFCD
jgi:hypothetical protein